LDFDIQFTPAAPDTELDNSIDLAGR